MEKPARAPQNVGVASLPVRGHRAGRIVAYIAEGLEVACPAGVTSQMARTTLARDAQAMRDAAAKQQAVLVVFKNEAGDKPSVVGLLDPTPAPAIEATEATEAIIDGRRVMIAAQDEIVLQCGGAASITYVAMAAS